MHISIHSRVLLMVVRVNFNRKFDMMGEMVLILICSVLSRILIILLLTFPPKTNSSSSNLLIPVSLSPKIDNISHIEFLDVIKFQSTLSYSFSCSYYLFILFFYLFSIHNKDVFMCFILLLLIIFLLVIFFLSYSSF